MTFWWLAWKDLLLTARDKKALLTLLAMPLLLIAILGAAFGNMMNNKDAAIQKFTLGVADLDQGQLSKMLVENIFKKELSKQIEVKTYREGELNNKIKDQTLPVGIVIEPGFTNALMTGGETRVTLLSVPNPGIKATLVEKVIEQFAASVPIEAAAAKAAQPVQAGGGIQPKHTTATVQLLNETTVNAKTKIVSSFQYYAAAMGVMFLLMTVVQGVSNIILEKEQEVYKRLLLTNLTYSHYLIGKMIGLVIISLIQAFLIIIGTKLFFGVDWGVSTMGVVMTTVAFVINACGLGLLAGTLVKTEKSFSVAGMFGSQILAALGGSMAPLYIFPDWVISVTKLLPNGLALQTYLKLMTGASFSVAVPAILGSLGMGVIFFAISLIRLSFERRGKYA